MTNEDPSGDKRSGKTRRPRAARMRAEERRERTCIEVERSGDWMPVEELRDAVRAALGAGHDVALNLDRIEHLDASALQILLALGTEEKKLGGTLELQNVSPHLRQWFEYAGALERFFPNDAKCN